MKKYIKKGQLKKIKSKLKRIILKKRKNNLMGSCKHFYENFPMISINCKRFYIKLKNCWHKRVNKNIKRIKLDGYLAIIRKSFRFIFLLILDDVSCIYHKVLYLWLIFWYFFV